ncbi:MAG TPA: tetraacyldisaccharide 4'-kinase [Gammaproteobacteria bacterium]|nr:tetraacyldisaccharide 4'-kinase [Gammaproteobacteria bacterium]
MSLSERLQRHWYRIDVVSLLLAPLSLIYGAVISVRRTAYASGLFKIHEFAIPIVVVGNLTVGGTGKTPFVMALAKELERRGWRPGIVSRGYHGTASQPALVPVDGDPEVFGDEPVLISRKTGLPVVVAQRRSDAVNRILAESVDLVISDDGLQHLSMQRNVEIVMIDDTEGFGNGMLLPAGPLREPTSRLDSVDIRVRRGGRAGLGEYAVGLHLGEARNLVTGKEMPLADFRDQALTSVAGIHRAGRFFEMLREQGLTIKEYRFPDHHQFLPGDLPTHNNPLLMTEKDAVKCARFAKSHWWSVPLRTEIPEALVTELESLLGKHP